MRKKIGPDFMWSYTLAIIYCCILLHLENRVNSDEYFMIDVTQE